MSPDDMADYHDHMSEFCRSRAHEDPGLGGAMWLKLEAQHYEAYQYWCRQANPGREKAREND